MVRKALLVGINEYKFVRSLDGCHNDVVGMRYALTTYFGCPADAISVLVDASVTKDRLLERMNWLFRNVATGEHVLFQFSGHGSRIRDIDGDEADRTLNDYLDEILCLYDMDPAFRDPNGYLTDDEVSQWTRKLPPGVKLTVIFDTCHSGTATRAIGSRFLTPLPASSAERPTIKSRYLEPPIDILARIDETRDLEPRRLIRTRGEAGSLNHFFLAAAAHDQEAADAFIDGHYHGAFSYGLYQAITRRSGQLTYQEALAEARRELHQRGFAQRPQLETSSVGGQQRFLG
jgi:hypothetical protein